MSVSPDNNRNRQLPKLTREQRTLYLELREEVYFHLTEVVFPRHIKPFLTNPPLGDYTLTLNPHPPTLDESPLANYCSYALSTNGHVLTLRLVDPAFVHNSDYSQIARLNPQAVATPQGIIARRPTLWQRLTFAPLYPEEASIIDPDKSGQLYLEIIQEKKPVFRKYLGNPRFPQLLVHALPQLLKPPSTPASDTSLEDTQPIRTQPQSDSPDYLSNEEIAERLKQLLPQAEIEFRRPSHRQQAIFDSLPVGEPRPPFVEPDDEQLKQLISNIRQNPIYHRRRHLSAKSNGS